MREDLVHLLNLRRAEHQNLQEKKNAPIDAYAVSVKVDFFAVLERNFNKTKGAA